MTSSGAGGIVPRRAAVRPRVRSSAGEAALLLEHHVKGLLGDGATGVVNLFGPSGSGKTTAIEHLAAEFSGEPRLILLDTGAMTLPESPAHALAICTSAKRLPGAGVIAFEMSEWTDDDLIEFLLASHRQRVQSVMWRVNGSSERLLLGGSPMLWRIVLDALAADDAHADIWDALRWQVGMEFSDPIARFDAQVFSFATIAGNSNLDLPFTWLGQFDARAGRLLAHRCVQLLLATELVIADLGRPSELQCLSRPLPRDLIERAAAPARNDAQAIDGLRTAIHGKSERAQSNAASLLHAANVGWRPDKGFVPNLGGAFLDGAVWPSLNLTNCSAELTSFQSANLVQARFDRANIKSATFRSACLRAASLDKVQAAQANFSNCDLAGASALNADLTLCSFKHADLDHCDFSSAVMCGADLSDCNARHADFSWADLQDANFAQADFSGAIFRGAILDNQDLTVAEFGCAIFHKALMNRCHLEYMELVRPNFISARLKNALLTGSKFYNAAFQNADLSRTGLADIEWKNCDLRDADFTEASFHAGSTRCGLVASTIPSEGSKTGFYTDDFNDRDFKSPEEIRKASLYGSDLRGAKTDGVDFYLVDLRRARFTTPQAEWFKKCGAILA